MTDPRLVELREEIARIVDPDNYVSDWASDYRRNRKLQALTKADKIITLIEAANRIEGGGEKVAQSQSCAETGEEP